MAAPIWVSSNSPRLIPALTINLPVSNFAKIYTSGILSDITLRAIGGKTYLAHKIILANESEYFMKLFTTKLRDPGPIISLDIQPEILEIYLKLIYEKHIDIPNWRDAMDLFKFIKFTLTSFPKLDDLFFKIKIDDTKEYPEFVSIVIHDFYQGEVPIEFIQTLGKAGVRLYDSLNYYNLGEEFTRTLIEIVRTDDNKYRIAKKAVADGLDPSLYHLVNIEGIQREMVTSESRPYLKYINPNLLTENISDALTRWFPVTVVIRDFGKYDAETKRILFPARGSRERFIIEIKVSRQDEMGNYYLPYQGGEILADKLRPGTVITIKRHNISLSRNILVEEFDIIDT